MMKIKFLTVLIAGVLTAPMAANAALVTQLIHFDDASNGWKWYSDVDTNFLFDPTNLQSSTLCADSTNGGNGSCVIEGKQGVLPRMTRPQFGPQSQGSSNDAPIVSGTDQLFTLDSFYFLLTGNGTGAENAITATGSNLASFTFQLGGNYDGAPLPDVTFYEGLSAGALAGSLNKQTGYIASFGTLFQDVSWIQFSAPTTAQIRLDCVVTTFDGTTSEPLSGFKGGCGTSTTSNTSTTSSTSNTSGNVPEPSSGALALLAVALLGGSLLKRRKA